MKPIDLHVHSNRSDGTFTPSQLVDYAVEKGLAAFALTDHDTVDGLDEAIGYAEKLRASSPAPGFGAKTDVRSDVCAADAARPLSVPEVIPGIEFSTEYQGKDIHIVGLDIDYHQEDFAARLQEFVDSRILRNKKMCMLLQKAGVDITYEALLEAFPGAVITRAHYARYLFDHGYVKSLKEAFERYVGDHCPCFVPREKVTPVQAVELILAAGGIPVLAHPVLYHMSDSHLDALTSLLTESGLIGIEALYSTYSPAEERHIRALAEKHHLCISGGSDFHGANKPGLDLAVGYGNLFVPYSVLEDLRRTSKKSRAV
jgi:hypothetical protein